MDKSLQKEINQTQGNTNNVETVSEQSASVDKTPLHEVNQPKPVNRAKKVNQNEVLNQENYNNI